jgi:hypothetical protein
MKKNTNSSKQVGFLLKNRQVKHDGKKEKSDQKFYVNQKNA